MLSSCTSEEVQEMEQNYQNCHTKMQYKVKVYTHLALIELDNIIEYF